MLSQRPRSRAASLASLTAVLLFGGAVAVRAADVEDAALQRRFPAADASTIRLDLPVGSIEVQGSEVDEVRTDLAVRCKRRHHCEDIASSITVESSLRHNRLTVELKGFPHFFRSANVEIVGTIWVPAGKALDIDMGVGELRIGGLVGDVKADLGVGEVRLAAPMAGVGRVKLDSGIGETQLRLPEGHSASSRSHLIGSETRWQGAGTHTIAVDLGVGEITADLADH